MSAIKKIGFVGLGNMGNPMAGHLVKAGFDVTVYDIRPEAVKAFSLQHAVTAAASLVDVAQGADAVITMLPDDKVVRRVVLGDGTENCVAAGLARGSVVLDMSTSDPTGTRGLAAALAPRGIAVVDAPVMGGVVFAKDATLDIMVGGDAALVERCRPIFTALGRSVIRCGGIGTAHALKALANYVNACALINAIEAMMIGKRLGLDPRLMADALIPMCAGRNHPIEKKVIPHVLTRKFGTGMAMGFIAKDVKIAMDAAKSVGAFAPLGERVSELWSAAADQLGFQLDQTEIARYWEEANGITLADGK
ncbi:MAG: NAD(P)-dependent oxidoreductase [Betaproteobacteria bacterium]|nr:NAD(P)-dependent oxidoreductase [Betaproteobacteria bacterium]